MEGRAREERSQLPLPLEGRAREERCRLPPERRSREGTGQRHRAARNRPRVADFDLHGARRRRATRASDPSGASDTASGVTSTSRVGAIDVANTPSSIRFERSRECVRVRFASVARVVAVVRVCAILRKSIRNRHVGALPRKKFFRPRDDRGRRPAASPARCGACRVRAANGAECTSAQKRKLHLFCVGRKRPTALQAA